MARAVFLDRDGVINRKASGGGYIVRWEDIEVLPGVAEGIATLNQMGFLVIIVTNQRCVAKRLVSAEGIERLHHRMCLEFRRANARIDAVFFCPHEIFEGCDCRKPKPGMLFEAARTHHINLEESWMVGDSDADIQAGKAAGCRTVALLSTGSPLPHADANVHTLLDAARFIKQAESDQSVRSAELR